MEERKKSSSQLHQLAVATAVSTLVLVSVGGLVTTEGAGMTVPDWPTSFGYNMFALPLPKWVGGVLYEHSHRLLGSVVGMLSLALAVVVWLRERQRGVRWLATAVLFAVIAQGVLGGLRVLLVNADLAMVHAVTAHTFFGLTVALALITSPGWQLPMRRVPAPSSRLWPIVPTATAVIFVQLILGVITRHTRLATTAHVAGAMLVFLAVVIVVYESSRYHDRERALFGTACLMLALYLAQFAVGVWALVLRAGHAPDAPLSLLQSAVPTAHVALGALIFATGVALSLLAWKSSRANSGSFVASTLANEPAAQSTAQA